MIFYSKQESNLLGLKIGRMQTAIFDKKKLFQKILNEEYDLIRLKVDSQYFDINHQIEKLGIPYYYCGNILRYEMHFFDLPEPIFKIPSAEFILYTPQYKKLLFNMICESFEEDPLGYYKNPLVSLLLSKKEEVHSMASFYVEKMNNPKNKMFFLKMDKQLVGFISIFLIKEGVVDTPISGVIKSHRGKHVFDDLRSFRHQYCLNNNITLGLAGARSENFYSQKTFVKDGMIHVGSESIYQITPLLSKKQESSLKVDFSIQYDNLQKALPKFQQKIILEHQKLISQDDFYLMTRRTCINESFRPSKFFNIQINTVIKSNKSILTVSKIYDVNHILRIVVYSQFQRFDI